jgi:hypothetical protein
MYNFGLLWWFIQLIKLIIYISVEEVDILWHRARAIVISIPSMQGIELNRYILPYKGKLPLDYR